MTFGPDVPAIQYAISGALDVFDIEGAHCEFSVMRWRILLHSSGVQCDAITHHVSVVDVRLDTQRHR